MPPIITTVLQLLALFAAFRLGQMQATPQAKWPKGNLTGGGWEAQKPYALGLVIVSAGLAIFKTMGGGGGMMMGMGGGYSDY